MPIAYDPRFDGINERQNRFHTRLEKVETVVDAVDDNYQALSRDVNTVKTFVKIIGLGVWGLVITGLPVAINSLLG